MISLLALTAWLLGSSVAIAQLENFDYQSPQEIEDSRLQIEKDFAGAIEPQQLSRATRASILRSYDYLDPRREVPPQLLRAAILFFDQNKPRFSNRNYISVIDFKPRSDLHRMFIIDMITGKVEKFHTTHGSGSDSNRDGIATLFGNVPGSRKSSLGFIKTGEVYFGRFQRSLRLDGLSTTNSNLRERAIVFHGWDNVIEANVIQGWSAGCPTMDWRLKDAAIDKIRDGSLMYIGN